MSDPADPVLVAVCGPPGVGKTTVASVAVDLLDARLLRTDVVRTALFPEPSYTDAEKEAVYDELFDRARTALAAGEPAVLDGTFRTAARRDRAAGVADAAGVPIRLLRVTADADVVEARVRAREDDASDADVAVARRYRASFEPVAREHATVDNGGDVAATARRVAVALGRDADATRVDND